MIERQLMPALGVHGDAGDERQQLSFLKSPRG